FSLPPGSQILRWRYFKDKDTNLGLDAAWLDDVVFTSLSWLEIAGPPTNNQCPLILHGTAGKAYEIQCSPDLATWFSLGVVTLTNDTVLVFDADADAGTRFYRLREFPNGSVWFDAPKHVESGLQWVLHSAPGLRFEIQASTNLANWTPVAVITNTLGTVPYTDPLVTNFSARFYRAKRIF